MFVRITSAITAGSIITLGIFYLMQSLIDLNPIDVDDGRDRHVLGEWILDDRTTELIVDDPMPEKEFIKPPEAPKSKPEPSRFASVTGVTGIPTPPPPIDTGPVTGINPDGPLVNVIRVEPDYPAALAARGIEGWVVVQFDVTPQGTVINAVAVASSHPGFEKSALKAAQRFRYKARVVDGIPVATHGIRAQFTYRMDE